MVSRRVSALNAYSLKARGISSNISSKLQMSEARSKEVEGEEEEEEEEEETTKSLKEDKRKKTRDPRRIGYIR